jgi:NAD(P)H-dependent FMN reductase
MESKIGTAKIRVAVIYGSTRKGRFCDKVARWTSEQIRNDEKFSVEVVDPASADTSAMRPRLEASNAFVVVTPEYNHGYPAPLKALIDSIGAEWHAKPVAFVSYGGVSGGLRAVEQLRLVFAELHAVTIRDAVTFASAWEQFDDAGTLLEPERAGKSMAIMLTRLHWWAIALRDARIAMPYTRAA